MLGNISISITPDQPELQAIVPMSKKLPRLLLQQKAFLKDLALPKPNFQLKASIESSFPRTLRDFAKSSQVKKSGFLQFY